MLIEISGTPGSGKSSIINSLCCDNRYDCRVIELDNMRFDFRNSTFESKILWSIFNTYAKIMCLENDKENNINSLTILNRGLFDRIVWAKLLKLENSELINTAYYIEKLFKEKVVANQPNIIFLLLTSYEKIIARKPKYLYQQPQPPWIVNLNTIGKLNRLYIETFHELKDELNIVLVDDITEDIDLEGKISIVQDNTGGIYPSSEIFRVGSRIPIF